jgi:multiple sugar transport system permease protein
MTPQPIFDGLANFARLVEDGEIIGVWLNTVVFVVATTVATFALGLAWAIILNQPFKGRTLVRSARCCPGCCRAR